MIASVTVAVGGRGARVASRTTTARRICISVDTRYRMAPLRAALLLRSRLAGLAEGGEQLGRGKGRFARLLVLAAATHCLVTVLALHARCCGAGRHGTDVSSCRSPASQCRATPAAGGCISPSES